MAISHMVVGLGNPGAAYAHHRHNVGFQVMENLCQVLEAPSFIMKGKDMVATCRWHHHEILLCKPMAYMNLSGQGVASWVRFYKLPPQRVLVIHDDLEVPLGTVKYKEGGGHGGHNGLRHISACMGSDYGRIRVGIGRPAFPSMVSGYVLSDFSSQDRTQIEEARQEAVAKVLAWIQQP